MKFLAAILGSFLLLTALPARAQSPNSAAKPANSPAKAPVSATPEKKTEKGLDQ